MGRPNKFGFEYNGVYRTSAEWGKVLGMRTDVINHRIRRAGRRRRSWARRWVSPEETIYATAANTGGK